MVGARSKPHGGDVGQLQGPSAGISCKHLRINCKRNQAIKFDKAERAILS